MSGRDGKWLDPNETAKESVAFVLLQAFWMPCLCCGRNWLVRNESNEAQGIFNVFCPDGECEDRYAARQ